MKVLFLGGVFDDSHVPEIASKTKKYIEFPANNFQKKILKGLAECSVNPTVISAPFLGAYPTAYKDMFFEGFDKHTEDNSGYTYVHFNNIWGLRNPSRSRALKKAVKSFIQAEDSQKLIIVYTPHTPLIQAANYAKKKDSRIKICLVIPDLPQYMNLSEKISPVYKLFKRFDVNSFMKESRAADSFVLLTEQMADAVEVGSRPYEVIEGIYEPAPHSKKEKSENISKIVYTGKLNRSFGALDLVEAFSSIKDDSLRLIICGSGDDSNVIADLAAKDERIDFRGQVSSEEAADIADKADILVNPRKNNTEYTKYSFPSKVIDYLATENSVVAYELDGMPDVYRDFIYYVPDDSRKSLSDTLIRVLKTADEDKEKKSKAAIKYLEEELSCANFAKKILNMNFPCREI